MKKNKILAVLTALFILFSFFFSVLFPSAQASHVHKQEETCVICATIQECNELARSLSSAVVSSDEETALGFKFFRLHGFRIRTVFVRRRTLVSLKVKLSN